MYGEELSVAHDAATAAILTDDSFGLAQREPDQHGLRFSFPTSGPIFRPVARLAPPGGRFVQGFGAQYRARRAGTRSLARRESAQRRALKSALPSEKR